MKVKAKFYLIFIYIYINIYLFINDIDDRFVIKQLSRPEMDAFLKFADEYFDYINNALYNKVHKEIILLLIIIIIIINNNY